MDVTVWVSPDRCLEDMEKALESAGFDVVSRKNAAEALVIRNVSEDEEDQLRDIPGVARVRRNSPFL